MKGLFDEAETIEPEIRSGGILKEEYLGKKNDLIRE
jgi:hypothetical protein